MYSPVAVHDVVLRVVRLSQPETAEPPLNHTFQELNTQSFAVPADQLISIVVDVGDDAVTDVGGEAAETGASVLTAVLAMEAALFKLVSEHTSFTVNW